MTRIHARMGLVLSLMSVTLVEGLIKAPITAQKKPVSSRRLAKKDSVDAVLENEEIMYSMEIELGTPGQKVVLQVDTGSSELWVDPDCSTAASGQQGLCQNYGYYDPTKSSTARGPASEYGGVAYGDGSKATFAYFEDALTIGGAAVTQIFGVAVESSDIYAGLIGLGPDLDYGFERDMPYSLPLNSMAAQGAIASRAFSLDLRGYDESEGAVIFGGLDRGRFYGRLQKIPIVASAEGAYRLTVEFTSAGQTLPDGTEKTYPFADGNVLLDSGATASLLREDLVAAILADMGASQTEAGSFVAPCALRGRAGSVDFAFGGAGGDGAKWVQVPYGALVRDVRLPGDDSYCYVGLGARAAGEQQVLGDSFLRAAYVVFDWDNAEAHIGQAADCGSDVVEVGSGAGAVPAVAGCDEGGGGGEGAGRPGLGQTAADAGAGDAKSAAARAVVVGGSAVAAFAAAVGAALL